MIPLEDRLAAHFDRDSVALPAPTTGSVAAVRARARQRRRRRQIGTGAGAAVVLAAAVLGAAIVATPEMQLDASSVPELPAGNGPGLTWHDAGTIDMWVLEAVWTGERFVALAHQEPDRLTLFSSADGTSWEQASGIERVQGVWSGDGAVLAWSQVGGSDTASPDGAGSVEVFRSTDDGLTFSRLGTVDVAEDLGAPLLDYPIVDRVVQLDGTVYVGTRHSAVPDVEQALAAAGREDLAEQFRSGGDYGFVLGDGDKASPQCNGKGCDDMEHAEEISFADMGLDPTQVQLVTDEGWATVHRLRSSGEAERTARRAAVGVASLGVTGNGSSRRLVMPMAGPDVPSGAVTASSGFELMASADGSSWESMELPLGTSDVQVAADGTLLSEASSLAVVRSTDGGETWNEATPDLWTEVTPNLVGPTSTGPGGLVTVGSVNRANTGDEIAVATGSDLPAAPRTGVPVIGWSPDGTQWRWQTAGQAFGPETEQVLMDIGNLPIQVVVGRDRIVALVPSTTNEYTDGYRVFVADVPS